MPFFLGFTFILQFDNVSGVAMSIAKGVVMIGEGSFRLCVFSGIPRSHREKIK
jgi:hypothetical protein